MIRTPTTFVIGAGASRSYGLPTGQRLHASALALQHGHDIFRLLCQCSFESSQINDFLADLRRHPAPSIDAFLESRQDRPETMKVGRALITALMGHAVSKVRDPFANVKREEDWLWWILDRMRQGAPTCRDFADGNSELRFVTFNFDSIIEHRLRRELNLIYRDITVPEISLALERFPVLHVHGRLPEVPTVPFTRDGLTGFDHQWTSWVTEGASKINVVLDAIDSTTRSAVAEAVSRPAVLCFLGFAYGSENLGRLGIPGMFNSRSRWPEMIGSAYGLRTGEQDWVRGRLHDIKLGGIDKNCVDTIRDFHIFRD